MSTAAPPRRRLRSYALTALFALAVAVAAGAIFGNGDKSIPNRPVGVLTGSDPFAYAEAERATFERRAAAGFSHVVYAKSPGGVIATARRTERYRPVIRRVARKQGFDPDTLEAIVFLESAGRPEAKADPRLEGAVGLTQILAQTGTGLLGMKVDTAKSRRLTKQIARAQRRRQRRKAARLSARRRRVDERFDPAKSVAATGRYLAFARSKLAGRDDLAVAGYHMGVGNLQSVLSAYGGAAPSYAQVYFDSSPTVHPKTWRKLYSLGDDSSSYYWRVLASRAILREYRSDPGALRATAALQTAKATSENAMHPPADTTAFADPDALAAAYRDGTLRPFPDAPRRLGLRRDRGMGALARKVGAPRNLYRGLRPDAYALAAYLARQVRAAGGGRSPLTVTSTVRDKKYQQQLIGTDIEATRAYSLHTTGYAFDVLRRYSGNRQALAFQFTLDRLQALNLIAWAREPAAIHVTAGGESSRLVPLLRNSG